MLKNYKKHVEEREKLGIPPLPLDVDQTTELVELLKEKNDESELLLFLLKERIPAGVDQSAYVKAAFLSDITKGSSSSPYISKSEAVEILGTMLGGYNIQPLIECLKIEELGEVAAKSLSNTLLILDAFNEINEDPTLTEIFDTNGDGKYTFADMFDLHRWNNGQGICLL